MNTAIFKEFSRILNKEVGGELKNLCTLVKVDTTSDLRYAKVFLSIYPEHTTPSTLKKLSKLLPEIQKGVARNIRSRSVPRISLVSDATEKNAQIVENLLKDIEDEKVYDNNTRTFSQ
jgi:ribosome-binding factor A